MSFCESLIFVSKFDSFEEMSTSSLSSRAACDEATARSTRSSIYCACARRSIAAEKAPLLVVIE